MSNYYVIHCTEDGDIYLHTMASKEVLLKTLRDRDWGKDANFCTAPPSGEMTNLHERFGLFIFKGKILLPKEVKVVKEYDIE